MNPAQQPAWWTAQQTDTWDRMKEALRRDWDQTRHDFGSEYGQDLNQDLTDTVRQAAGADPIPPKHVANPVEWSDEAAVRYGYGAALSADYHDHVAWDAVLEGRLKKDWEALDTGRSWDSVRLPVHYGWIRSPRIMS